MISRSSHFLPAQFYAVALLFASALPMLAQVAPTTAPAKPVAVNPVPVVVSPGTEASDKDVLQLSPFTVNTSKDSGFMASNAGTATRLSLDMKDVPAPYSVMTRDFIDALGLTSVQQATMWAVNGGNVPDGNGADTFGISTIVQVRGVILANGGSSGGSATTRNNYLSQGIQDSYNLERYEFGRGPNAALFSIGANSPLGGSLGSSTKVARTDKAFETIEMKYGSWGYKRATLDVNRPLTDKLAMRANLIWMDRDAWKEREFERVKGITLAGSYLITPKTQLKVEGSSEHFERAIAQVTLFDRLSGWDGFTVFREPISNAIRSTGATPGAPNFQGQTLTYNGEPQGVDRYNGGYYIWDPSQNMIMNYQNTAITRRGDETARTPILANGVLYTRGTDLPIGNGSGNRTPTTTTNGNNINFLFQDNLPAGRFDRALPHSNFVMPSKTENNTTDAPIFRQKAKDFNMSLSHQIGTSWFFELGADANQTEDRRQNMGPLQTIRLDLNQLLPNGTTNSHFLTPYADAEEEWRYVTIDNRAVRYNLAYRTNLGKWGEYVFNFNGSYSTRETAQRFYRYTMRRNSDHRYWLSNDEIIRVRHYWYEDRRPFGDASVIPNSVFRRDFASDNNSFVTTTESINPDWTLYSQTQQKQTFFNNGMAMSAKYFDGKLVMLGAFRHDSASTHQQNGLNTKGYYNYPTDWNGVTPYFLPDAPADYTSLTYIPRNSAGVPTSTIPIAASSRPTLASPTPAGLTANAGNMENPLYANDRFRNDYSPPENKKNPTTYSIGPVYNIKPWMALVANYATSYKLPNVGQITLADELAEVQTGSGYDLGLRFNLLQGQLTISTGYFYNEQNHVSVGAPTTSPINNLYGRNAATDGLSGSRNNLGFGDIIGTDYSKQKNSGYELEVIGQFKNGLRLTWNVGSGQLQNFDRYPLAKDFVLERADSFKQVLEAAGGRLDTSVKPTAAPHAPGTAFVNTAITAAIPSEQTNAVNDYNNIWLQYEGILTDQPTLGVNKVTSNAYADYTLRSGWLKGLRVGFGVQYRGDNISGYRTGDTVLDSSGNPVLQYGPVEGLQHPVFTPGIFNTVASLGYTMRLKGGDHFYSGKEIEFQLNIDNVLNKQAIIYQDDTVTLRPPGGDLSLKYREAIPTKNAIYQQPISAIFTMRLKL